MKRFRKIIIICVIVGILSAFFMRDNDKPEIPNLSGDFTVKETELTFGALPSGKISLSEKSVSEVLSLIDKTQPEYKWAEYYYLPEVEKRMDFDATVSEHKNCVIDEHNLTAEYLAGVVIKNNEGFKNSTYEKYKKLDEEYVKEICVLIVKTVNIMREKYPELDWERVYCNLSNLKILYEVGMLAYAQVSANLIMSVSETNMTIAELSFGDSGYRNVLVHEIMHLLQVGCLCENIGNEIRRAGIAVYWDDFNINTTDWMWLIEGAAERLTCKTVGCDAISYQYKMDYLCSYNMSVMLRDSVAVDAMERLSLAKDPHLLFDVFGCSNQKQKEEVLKLIITTNILQSQPTYFYEHLKEKTGYNPNESEEELSRFGYYLKSDICLSLAKEFYENLASFICEKEIPSNDVLFLINIFEGHINQHLKFSKESQKEYNESFLKQYIPLRAGFFSLLDKDNPQLDFASLYEEYSIISGNILNAELAVLSKEKRDFYIERAQWQKDNLGLGQKVPVQS